MKISRQKTMCFLEKKIACVKNDNKNAITSKHLRKTRRELKSLRLQLKGIRY